MKEYEISNEELEKDQTEQGAITCPHCKGTARRYAETSRKSGNRSLGAMSGFQILNSAVGSLNFGCWWYYECLDCKRKWRRDMAPVPGEPCQVQHNKIELIQLWDTKALFYFHTGKIQAHRIADKKTPTYRAYIDIPSLPGQIRDHVCAYYNWMYTD